MGSVNESIRPGDRVLLVNQPRTPEWFNVLAVNVTPPAQWNDPTPRLEVDGGCGGGSWLPAYGEVLSSYSPADEGGLRPEVEEDTRRAWKYRLVRDWLVERQASEREELKRRHAEELVAAQVERRRGDVESMDRLRRRVLGQALAVLADELARAIEAKERSDG